MRIIPGSVTLEPLLVLVDRESFLSEFVGLGRLSAGVGVYGEAAAYALVWELGSRRLKSPGPKTMWSVNRNQEAAILTKQAPYGYVTPTDGFFEILEEEISRIDFGRSTTPRMTALMLSVALDNASQRIARIIRDRAPIDSGELRAGIMAVDSDEADFLAEDPDLEARGTLIL